MTESAIRIKGIREGLLVTVGEEAHDSLLQVLQSELGEKADFLQGSRVTLEVGDLQLHRPLLSAVQALFAEKGLELWAVLSTEAATRQAARELALATRRPGSNTDLEGNRLPAEEQAAEPEADPLPTALFIKETLRSGRSIYHEGPVVILGDVNPGAEVIAAGDVIVWGRLRGLVHAGALGDDTAVICALELTPTQLRIADQIAIAPENRSQPAPEKASIREGQIVADFWRLRP